MHSFTSHDGNIRVVLFDPHEDHLDGFYWKRTMSGSGSIAESLASEVPTWIHQNAIFICAQPGRGKTTFVRDVIIEQAVRTGENVLLLSSRTANSLQQKRMIAKQLQTMELLEDLTERGLQKHTDFGHVKICTYQGVSALLNDRSQEKWLRNVKYVVFDECQYFAVDSLFNAHAGYTLRELVHTFSNAIRIYMTATPYDVQYTIAQAEQHDYDSKEDFVKNQRWFTCNRYIRYYNFLGDYSSYKVEFFTDYSKFIPEIIEKPEEKWLIFCESKARGLALQEDLKTKHKIKAAYLDADQKNTEVWAKLCREERFDEQVLICTTVLDCGVNVHDKALRHIVLTADNQTTFIQCLGRKRLDPHETVRVHVMDLDTRRCANLRNTVVQKLALLGRYDTMPHSELLAMLVNEPDLTHHSLFYCTKDGDLCKNRTAEYVLRRRKDLYDRLLSGETTLEKEVQRWLQYSAEVPNEDLAEPINCFYEEHKGSSLDPDAQDTLRNLILRYAKSVKVKTDRKSREQTLDTSALNRILEDSGLCYLISPKWVLHRSEEV